MMSVKKESIYKSSLSRGNVATQAMMVLGIDVGLRVNGYVICRVNNLDVNLIEEGEIKAPASYPLPKRLFYIYSEASKVIQNYEPSAMVVEKLYSHYRHPTTIALLAQVRGVILLLAQEYGLQLYEYSSTKARKSCLGRGHANSSQVKKMVENTLKRPLLSQHTADAFSLVVALSHTLKSNKLYNDWKNQR